MRPVAGRGLAGGFDAIYLLGKFGSYLLLVAGTLRFTHSDTQRARLEIRILAAAVLLFAVLLPWYQRDLNAPVWVQSPAACVAGLLCAYLFWRQYSSHSFGTRYCTAMFVAMGCSGLSISSRFRSTTTRDGDEFVLIMPTADPADALHRIRDLLKHSPKLTWREHTLHLSASLGATNWPKGTDLQTVLHQADQLMYEDKRHSKSARG